ncbi:hypothetical protein B0A54_16185 [Friedmanniomyces endolithicus]|uniref:Methyltransferase n=1 Tax=Friedmanniomyces endolithicus TaxID=329885 RepID=A0A4U0U4K1_9PEZI|nr:hypothetical protein LTS09_014522 [Friedmanniomyces endolithicus]TKA29075.1 hypothetical protein B0A54_16185 [Friedmanniomyces endolithicus]
MTTTTTTTTTTQTQTKFATTPDIDIVIPRGPTTATLTFYSPPPDGSAPYNYVETPPPNHPQRNYAEAPHPVTISDIRGRETDFSTDTNGFAVLQNLPPSAERDFTDDERIKQTYYPEVQKLLLENLPGQADRVVIFDHTIRRSHPGARRAPVTRAHIDQTTRSAEARVHQHMSAAEAPELLKGRVRLVNVWRPLNGPVVASPLAFADSRSVPDSEIVGVEHRYPDRTGETAGVKFFEGAEWYYWSGIGNGERILLQCYDSEKGARTPHTAFVDPRTGEGWRGRESIEVRALVFG